MGEHSTHAIGGPDVARVEPQHLLVHGERPVLVPALLVSVTNGLVQSLQPHISQRYKGVGVPLRTLENTLKLLLAGTPLLLGQMEVANQGP